MARRPTRRACGWIIAKNATSTSALTSAIDRGDPPRLRAAKMPRAERTGDREKDRLIFFDRERDERAGERPERRTGIEGVERPRDGRRRESVLVKVSEDQSGQSGG